MWTRAWTGCCFWTNAIYICSANQTLWRNSKEHLQRGLPRQPQKVHQLESATALETLNCREIEGDWDNRSKQTVKWMKQATFNRHFEWTIALTAAWLCRVPVCVCSPGCDISTELVGYKTRTPWFVAPGFWVLMFCGYVRMRVCVDIDAIGPQRWPTRLTAWCYW